MKSGLKRGVAALLGISLLLSGCASKASAPAETTAKAPEAEGQTTAAPAETKAPEKEKIKISAITMYPDELQDGVTRSFRTVIQDYLDNNPNITFEEEALAHDAYEVKIKTLAAADQLPDFFIIKGSMVPDFLANGQIEPINQYLDQDTEWKSTFKDGIFDDITYKNEIYGIPVQLSPGQVIFYNSEIFKKVGIEKFPETWTEFTDAVKLLKDNGYTPITLGNKGKWVAQCCMFSTLADRFTGTEWFSSITDRTGAKFTDPEFVNALKAFEELYDIGAFNVDANSIDNKQARMAYYNGTAAMMFEGGWTVSGIEVDAPDEIRSVTEFGAWPAVEGGKGSINAIAGGSGWAFAYNAKMDDDKKMAVMDLMKALSSEQYAEVSLGYSALSAVEANTAEIEVTPLFKKYMDSIENAKWVAVYDVRLPIAVNGVLETGLQEIMMKTATPEAVAEKIQAEYDRIQ